METEVRVETTLSNIWREAFAKWPADFRRKGVVVPSFGEAIPFVDFVLNDDMVVFERPTPDTVGSRRVAIPFLRIEAVKYTEPLNNEQFFANGFGQRLASTATASQLAPTSGQGDSVRRVQSEAASQAVAEPIAPT